MAEATLAEGSTKVVQGIQEGAKRLSRAVSASLVRVRRGTVTQSSVRESVSAPAAASSRGSSQEEEDDEFVEELSAKDRMNPVAASFVKGFNKIGGIFAGKESTLRPADPSFSRANPSFNRCASHARLAVARLPTLPAACAWQAPRQHRQRRSEQCRDGKGRGQGDSRDTDQ